MEGLEIIEHIAIEQVPDVILYCLLLLGCFSILIPAFAVYNLTKNGKKAFLAETISGIVYLVFLIGLLESSVLEKPTGEYQYKVKITEDVGYVEFTDKYDVVSENEDGTYIVQEKNHIKE